MDPIQKGTEAIDQKNSVFLAMRMQFTDEDTSNQILHYKTVQFMD